MLNAPVGVQRIVTRLRPAQARRASTADSITRRGRRLARAVGATLSDRTHPIRTRGGRRSARSGAWPVSRPTRAARRLPTIASLRQLRLTGERTVSATAVALVAIALVLSNLSTAGDTGPTGNTSGGGGDSRIAIGGGAAGIGTGGVAGIAGEPGVITNDVDGTVDGDVGTGTAPDEGLTIDGPFDATGTLIKPASVDTTVADGMDLMRKYRVKSGDTLTGIARRFGVSMMTIWWANRLSSKDDLTIGKTLLIPPVSGVVIKVGPADTLESLARKYRVDPLDILDANDLADVRLVAGQTLTIPGALAGGIPAPRPKPTPVPRRSPPSVAPSTRPPAQYEGGRFRWPVAGGYISQYFRAGHYGIDIAADQGTKVTATAAGTVIFAGWKNNGGGYQVWIAHGSNLYTTYNHMSSVSVGRGQSVSRGQQVGRVGSTGNSTGPHLMLDVWRGPIWNGGSRVNPLSYF